MSGVEGEPETRHGRPEAKVRFVCYASELNYVKLQAQVRRSNASHEIRRALWYSRLLTPYVENDWQIQAVGPDGETELIDVSFPELDRPTPEPDIDISELLPSEDQPES